MDEVAQSSINLSYKSAEVILSVFEDILGDFYFDDIAAVVIELREEMGLTPETVLTLRNKSEDRWDRE